MAGRAPSPGQARPTTVPSPSSAGGLLAPLPGWLRRTVAYGVAVLVVAAVVAVVAVVLLRVGVVAFALLAALLLTALLAPATTRLRRLGLPRSVAALAALLLLLGVPVGIGWFLYSRVMVQLEQVGPAVTEGLDRIRTWLVEGPLAMDPARIDELRVSALDAARAALPSPVAGTTTALHLLTGLLLVVFAVFFLAKDGDTMWRWLLSWVPERRRDRVDGGGRAAWDALTAYVRGTALVALGDAVGIGIGLLVLGVPLWLSLTLLTFVAAFVPIVGATVAGAAAVLVTLVTNGATDALLVLGLVLLVQQLEGNLLQPLVMSGVVRLHPLVVVSAVTVGTLVLGVAGAVLAVPAVAVAYRLTRYVTGRDEDDGDTDGDADGDAHDAGPPGRDRFRDPGPGDLSDGPRTVRTRSRTHDRRRHMQVSKSEVLDTLRTRGDDEQVRRAETELPDEVDTDRDAEQLRALGLGRADVAALASDTGLGSGQASGLGISLQSEPEPLDPREK